MDVFEAGWPDGYCVWRGFKQSGSEPWLGTLHFVFGKFLMRERTLGTRLAGGNSPMDQHPTKREGGGKKKYSLPLFSTENRISTGTSFMGHCFDAYFHLYFTLASLRKWWSAVITVLPLIYNSMCIIVLMYKNW